MGLSHAPRDGIVAMGRVLCDRVAPDVEEQDVGRSFRSHRRCHEKNYHHHDCHQSTGDYELGMICVPAQNASLD